MGKCRQCGACCRAIAMLYSKKDIQNNWSNVIGGSKAFVLENWKRISKEQSVKNNPHLASLMKEYQWGNQKTYWYTCKLLQGNRCSIHKERPPICKGYPWYDNEPDRKEFLYGENCGYQVDQLTGVK